ncbi:putative motility protein [Bradyrhizobium sp. ARR65]|uniref:putative motility protein n=1 Tax=Bradyrhizobium sp. ARR65 TaxID=1040989 RepID=UPI000464FA36|nr:putative motility protein [Bradyrhizobium sp. ARR65]
MDLVSMVSDVMVAKAGALQTQVATTLLKQNLDAQKSTVLTLLGAGQQPSLANVGAGIGNNLNISA